MKFTAWERCFLIRVSILRLIVFTVKLTIEVFNIIVVFVLNFMRRIVA